MKKYISKKLILLTIGATTLFGCSTPDFSDACVIMVNDSTYMVDESGCFDY